MDITPKDHVDNIDDLIAFFKGVQVELSKHGKYCVYELAQDQIDWILEILTASRKQVV